MLRPVLTLRETRAVLVAAVLLGACGGDDGSSSGGDGGAGTVVATGKVVEAMEGARFEDLTPLEAAEVCLHDAAEPTCTTTAADGTYRLEGLPAFAELALAIRHDGHQGVLMPLVVDERPPVVDVALERDEDVQARNSAAGASAAAGTGSVGLLLLDGGGVAGVGVELAASGFEGPFYVDAAGDPDPGLSATSDRGFAFAVGLPPGPVEATFSHDSRVCSDPALGWPASAGGDVRFPIGAGLETTVAVQCTIR